MSLPEDLHRYLKSSESDSKAQERAMNRMDAKDFDRSDMSNALFTCPSHRWNALQSAIALRDWFRIGKIVEDIFYEHLLEKEAERE